MDKKQQGKRNKINGSIFELRVRKDLESHGWIVSKWQNNIEWLEGIGKLIPAKRKYNPFNRAFSVGTGFPDFIAFKFLLEHYGHHYDIIGVESKSNGILDKVEKQKCEWLLDNKVFSRILIATKTKVKNRIVIHYKEFKKEENI